MKWVIPALAGLFALMPSAGYVATPAYTVIELPNGRDIVISDFGESQALATGDPSPGPTATQSCLQVRMFWNYNVWPARVAAEGIGTLRANAAAAQAGRLCPASDESPALFGFSGIESTASTLHYSVIVSDGIEVLRRHEVPTTQDELRALRGSDNDGPWLLLAVVVLAVGALLGLGAVAAVRIQRRGSGTASMA